MCIRDSYKGPVIGLMRDRDKLYERINLRVDMMFDAGLILSLIHIYG